MADQDAQTIEVVNSDLRPGDRIALQDGALSVQGEVYRSSMAPGLLVVETEAGSLYVDPESRSEVLADRPDAPRKED